MSARPSMAVEAAAAQAMAGSTISAAAKQHGVAVSSVRRALRNRYGQPPRTVPAGPAHHAFKGPGPCSSEPVPPQP